MTVLASGLVPRIGAERSIDGGIKSWIENGTYQPNAASTSTRVILDNISNDEFTKHTSFDLERFALSSWESYTAAKYDIENGYSISWPLLKLYYSSFFAAHALMRGQGSGLIKLESSQTRTLNGIIEITVGTSPKIAAGMYLYEIVADVHRTKSVVLTPAKNSQGVHIGFWIQFTDFLNERARSATSRGAADSLAFLAGVDELSRALGTSSGHPGGAWLSSVRNQINYQHLHRVWHPTKQSRKIKDAILPLSAASSTSIRLDTSITPNPVIAFINVCKYLACLNYEISEVVSQKDGVSGAFGSKWRRLVRESQ